VTIGRIAHHGVGEIDARIRQHVSHPLTVGVVAERADVTCPKPEGRTRGQRGRDLSAARDGMRRRSEFGVRGRQV